MSPQAIADPEELRRFAQNLKQFNTQLHNSMAGLKGQFDHLGGTWRDQEHRKFAEEFRQTMRMLDHFMGTCNDHIPFLLRKSERIRDYLNQR